MVPSEDLPKDEEESSGELCDDDEMGISHKRPQREDEPEIVDVQEDQESEQDEAVDTPPPPDQITEPPQRKSTRSRRPVDRYEPGSYVTEAGVKKTSECHEAMRPKAEPKSYKMAMKSPDAKQWQAACDKEMQSIREMGVWEVVDRPTNSPVVGGRWHFKLKLHPNGTIAKHKARYVAKGYTQTEGVDYNETYAPTGRLASFRILVAIAAAKGWDIEQMDAIAAFLNSDLQEVIYLELPEGYDEEKSQGKVARLCKALYGLKQSARCWSDEVKQKFKSMGLEQNPHDACLWYRKGEDD